VVGWSADAAARLTLIVEAQRDMAAAGTDLDAVMELVIERAQALTRAEGAMISLLEGDELVVRRAGGCASLAQGQRMKLQGSVARYAVESGQPLLVRDCESDPRINREMQRRNGDRSLICVPLLQGTTAIGALHVMSPAETERLDEDDRETMEMLSVALSAAVSHAAEHRARRAQDEAFGRLRILFACASIGILRSGPDERAVEANPAVEAMLGYSAAELAGMSFRALTHPEDIEASARLFGELMRGERDSYQLEARYLRKDASTMWSQITAALERDADGRPAFAVTMLEDISERKAAEEALRRQSQLNEHQALHDALTGLPNRALLYDRIDQAIRDGRREGTRVGVLVMDLDRFKEVNDSLGHHAGDTLLQALGDRLQDALREADTVARLGGDEFGIVLPHIERPDDLVMVVERMRETLEQPVVVQDLPLAVEASIGVAVCPDDGEDVATLLQRADVAMYAAKHDGAGCAFYDASLDQVDPMRLTLVAELRRALEERELVLHYQPKAVLASGEVASVEALVRWEHPERGLLMPDAFIPVAQETSLTKPLTLYVVAEALRQHAEWRRAGHDLAIAVNLSMRNLLDLDFPDEVAALLADAEMDPARLELEITESTVLADPRRTKAVLDRLSALGIRLSIDDFGTGYSSLAYLKRLPISEIKIDSSFVTTMDVAPDDATIVRSTIDLGRNLGLEVVAEGVETAAVWDELRALGCTVAQGYYLSRPVPPDELLDWMSSRARAPAIAAVRA
jgi:diguanylate cyclase (GGDEF)-like protein/PAS domain S-box-containing protein